jgi:hypothetical protein
VGRGSLAKVRWKHDRGRKKKARDQKKAAEHAAARKAAKRSRSS